jgi:hypothetical protein
MSATTGATEVSGERRSARSGGERDGCGKTRVPSGRGFAGSARHPERDGRRSRGGLAARGGDLGEGALAVVQARAVCPVDVERARGGDDEQQRREDEEQAEETRATGPMHDWGLVIRETCRFCNLVGYLTIG